MKNNGFLFFYTIFLLFGSCKLFDKLILKIFNFIYIFVAYKLNFAYLCRQN